MNHELFFSHSGILFDVLNERVRQDKKFGPDRHQHPFLWNTILLEEVGEVARASLEVEFDNVETENYRKELVETAAVAIAAILDLDNNGKYLKNKL